MRHQVRNFSNNVNPNNLQEIQKMKELELLNELERKYDKDKIKESVIEPKRLEYNNKDVELKYNKFNKEYSSELNSLHYSRTNQPYKNIIKNDDHVKLFLSKPRPETEEDKNILKKNLVVHQVTQLDKNKEVVDKKYTDLQKNLETHNKELKIIYSTNEELEHKKKFEYNHKFKYRVKYDPNNNDDQEKQDHSNLKRDNIKYYKEQQQKLEEGKNKKLEILECCINNLDNQTNQTPVQDPWQLKKQQLKSRQCN
jgi:hypothetical protein